MNKKLLVTATGLVLAGGMSLANADVKVYGQLDLSIDATDVDNGADDVNMGANRSAFGIKGKEDLGNGLSAFFKLEYQTDLDDASTSTKGTNEDDTSEGGNGLKGRDQYVGLQHETFGKLTFGSMSTAYKSGGKALDPWYRTRIQSRNIGLQSTLHKGRGEEGQGRTENTVRYDSPSFAGARFVGTYTFDNNEDDKGDGRNVKSAEDEDDNPYSLGVHYKGYGVYAFFDYITTNGGGDDDAWQLGAKYKMGDLAVWGIYERDGGLITLNQGKVADASNPTNQGADDGLNIWSLGASYTLGTNLVSFDYGQASNSGANVNNTQGTSIVGKTPRDNYAVWRIGAQHMFSKRTKVYAGYANTDADDSNAGEYEIFTVGMRHNF